MKRLSLVLFIAILILLIGLQWGIGATDLVPSPQTTIYIYLDNEDNLDSAVTIVDVGIDLAIGLNAYRYKLDTKQKPKVIVTPEWKWTKDSFLIFRGWIPEQADNLKIQTRTDISLWPTSDPKCTAVFSLINDFTKFIYIQLSKVELGNNTAVKKFYLSQNYPNPFNPETTISFSLPKSEFVTLEIYNLSGQKVSTLINKKMLPGNHSVNFNGSEFPTGTYIYKIQAGDFVETKKMTLLK